MLVYHAIHKKVYSYVQLEKINAAISSRQYWRPEGYKLCIFWIIIEIVSLILISKAEYSRMNFVT